jgi:peptidoglycan/LPS O-acetylase OafA/YrhL
MQKRRGEEAQRLNGLDHLRAFAVTYVVVYHYGALFPHPAWVERVSDFGWTGVDLFFVLSGYLLGGQLLRSLARGERISVGEFYLKRSLRILPAFLCVLALYFAVPGFSEQPTIAPLWKFLSFTQNLGLNPAVARGFSHAWSLCVEEQFYGVLPLLLIALSTGSSNQRTRWVIGAVLIGGMLLRGAVWEIWHGSHGSYAAWMEWIYYPTYARLDGLLVGVCIAGVQQFKSAWWERASRHWWGLFALGLALLGVAAVLCIDRNSLSSSVFAFPLVAGGYGCLLVAAVTPACFLHRIRFAANSVLAAWSYSLYLIHKAVINLSQEVLFQAGLARDGNATFLLALSAALGAAWALYAAVEQPFLRLRARLLQRMRGSSGFYDRDLAR